VSAEAHDVAPVKDTQALRRRQLRAILAGRMVDERLRSLYRQGGIVGGAYLGIGQEAFSAACGTCLRPGDIFSPLIRDQAGRSAFGESVLDAARSHMGKRSGPQMGRDGNIHRGRVEQGILPMVSHLGAMLSTTAGFVFARQIRQEQPDNGLDVGLAVIGDGGMACGATHEALNAMAVHRLPMVVAVANNQWSYSTPNGESFACDDLVDRAKGYGMRGVSIDGCDARASLEAMHEAVQRARAGEGPQMVVGRLLRVSGHAEHDDARYVPEDMRAAYPDVVAAALAQGIADGVLDEACWQAWREEIAEEIDTAFSTAEREADPDPDEERWSAYAEAWPDVRPTPPLPAQPDPEATSYAAAIRRALDDALTSQAEVFIYGEDVGGDFGGAFKITKGLAAKHPERVRNSPISEDAITGMAIGAALDGMRPVIEFQFADFSAVAFNQLANHASTVFWRYGRPCPLLARLPIGGTPGGGPFHSQMAESWYAHHPGLVVLAPATVADAYCMLRQALLQNDPVIFCEHKWLYERVRDDAFVPPTDPPPLCRVQRHHAGEHCTVVSWSAMLHEALTAAEQLEHDDGLSVDLLDLRCLRPFDLDGVLESLRHTGRLVVVSEDFPCGGIASELLAQVLDQGFQLLDAPPQRVTARDTPIPYQTELYAAHRPQVADIIAAVRDTCAF